MHSIHGSKRLIPLAFLPLILSFRVLGQNAPRTPTGKEQSSTSYLYAPVSAEGLGSATKITEYQKLLDDKLATGLYESASDVVRDGLRLMEQRDRVIAIEELRAKIAKSTK